MRCHTALRILPLLCAFGAPGVIADNSLPAIGIIIDDMGYRLHDGRGAIALPGPLAYSFLPHTPNVLPLATEAQRQGKDVLLHLPMEAIQDNLLLGPGALLADMDEQALVATLLANLASVPAAIGVNNHMGSLLTRQPLHMRWLMDAIKTQGLFFVDSRTTSGSVAAKNAGERAVPFLVRDIFIDNETNEEHIRKQLAALIGVAQRRGHALGIAHPNPSTIAVLTEILPQLDKHGVRLVGIRELLAMSGHARPAVAHAQTYE